MSAVIAIEDVTRAFVVGDTAVHALDGVSFAVEAGELVALVGSSGSGKSTLLSVLGCLDRPTTGRYRLDGTDVAGCSRGELARLRGEKLGFVFQSFQLLPRTTALDNVQMPLLYRRVRRSERRRRAREALERLGRGARVHHTPTQRAGGQQQRVAIARALVTGPRILLADEPTGNLDSRTSAEVMQIFRDLAAQGLTVIVVTHETDVAWWARRVITLRDGRIVDDHRVWEVAS